MIVFIIISVSSRPFNLTVGKVTDTTIDLTWIKPQQIEEIQGYNIYYEYDNYPSFKSVNITKEVINFTLSNLSKFICYNNKMKNI